MSRSLLRSVALLLVLASSSLAHEFTGDTDDPLLDPFTGKKSELYRTSREAKGNSELAQGELQQQNEKFENGQLNQNQVEQLTSSQNEQQQQQTANELPDFGGGTGAARVPGDVATESQVAAVDGGQQHQSSLTSSSSKAAAKSASSKTITTTTTTTTTQNNQDQPQVAQIREIRVHTVPLSEAVQYDNYMVVPTSARAANLEESSSSSSTSQRSSSSSTSTTSETEQVAPSPVVVVNPMPAAVAPDCVLHRMIIERPASSRLVVNVAPEMVTSHSSSSSSRSSKVVSHSAAAVPQRTVYTVRQVFTPPVVSARVVEVPVSAPASREEHSHFESRSSRQESNGVGHSMSSSSSSSSSRTSKSSTTTTSQTSAALVAPPPPPPTVVRTVTTLVRPPVVAVKAAPLVEVSSGRTNDVSVNVDHRQSGPNYNYGYSIKQHSSEPSTKGVVVGDRVVYMS